jgi:hypothetical protein
MSHAAAAPPAEHSSMELESSAADGTGAQSTALGVAAAPIAHPQASAAAAAGPGQPTACVVA